MRSHRALCLIRFGHRWETRADAVGSITYCARCGVLRRPNVGALSEHERLETTLGAEGMRVALRRGTSPADRR